MRSSRTVRNPLWILLGQSFVVIAVIALGGWYWLDNRVVAPPGLHITTQPVQRDFSRPPAPWQYNGYAIQPVATFSVEALVIHRAHYYWSRESELSPVDLALGWGPMSQAHVLNQLKIWQSGRFYFYAWEGAPPIPLGDIIANSTNVHTVPSTPELAEQLRALRSGDVVTLKGYLINITNADGWHWQSSTSRLDSGAGACEILWVEQLTKHNG